MACKIYWLVLDYVSDSLYILDEGRRMIEVISLRTKHKALIYRFAEEEIPISFCVVPEYGRLLVAVSERDYNNEIHIDSIGLDGSDKRHLLMNNILGPNVRLRYSSEMDIVYIADEGHAVIDFIHPEGTGRENFREIITTVASLAVSDTHVFWTDRHTQRLYWADVHKTGQIIRRMELSIFPNDTFLHLQITSPPANRKNPLTKHACFQNPSPCSHLCVQIPHPIPQDLDMGYKCLCPAGLLRMNDTCVSIKTCQHNEFYCHRSNDCFLAAKKCDGERDCKFGEDEENCPVPTFKYLGCSPGKKFCNNICIGVNEVCKNNSKKAPVSCSSTQYKCASSFKCVDKHTICDGKVDCPDGSDETPEACDAVPCSEADFKCTSGACVPNSWRCDKTEDCVDGSDEVGCEFKTCELGNFQCGDESCIPLAKRCDRNYDCIDLSDEDQCDLPELAVDIPLPCQQWEFSCEHNSSICLPLTARCNGKVDCPGGTDEVGCDFHCAPLGLYPCKQELMCVTRQQMCNGRNDCADGSDETIEACEKANKTFELKVSAYPVTACSNGFLCGNGQCVEWDQVCDGKHHCDDHTDENNLCAVPCHTSTCTRFCRQTPRGPQCVCPHGYTKVGETCTDIDECKEDVCSHVCHNMDGSYRCSCYYGYALRSDTHSCKSIYGGGSVLYTRGNTVWSMSSEFKHRMEYTHGDKDFSDLDYDYRNDKLYLSISTPGQLLEINGTTQGVTGNDIVNMGTPIMRYYYLWMLHLEPAILKHARIREKPAQIYKDYLQIPG
ncbi:unnamed protein product [Leptidea sinapis]|uniref:EGF-like domain-containing protein n=1 Tax=Leptidea sinapis TaxID=189913 RepID=A0A5E4PZ98_9NEOP|nr:unnamed protein product [Leptidea sinapis]